MIDYRFNDNKNKGQFMLSKFKAVTAAMLFLACTTLVLQPASAASINWVPYGPAAFKQAKASGKKLYVFGMLDSCHWCHKMQTTTFRDQALVTLINKKYVPVKLHVDVDTNTADQYQIMGVPTILILNSNGGVVRTLAGYKTADEMISALE